jgi:hypothetical protein
MGIGVYENMQFVPDCFINKHTKNRAHENEGWGGEVLVSDNRKVPDYFYL